MSNPPSIATSSKAAAPSGQLSPAQNTPSAIATGDSYGQRRSGGSSFGAGASTRSSPAPRNNQQSKKQHKGSKRFRQVDEDAIAESVRLSLFVYLLAAATEVEVYEAPHGHSGPLESLINPFKPQPEVLLLLTTCGVISRSKPLLLISVLARHASLQ
jgi:hypothetical protein